MAPVATRMDDLKIEVLDDLYSSGHATNLMLSFALQVWFFLN